MKLRNYLLFAVIFIAVEALGMAIMYHGFGVEYSSDRFPYYVIWTQVALALLVFFYVKRYASWQEVGYGKIQWVHMLWIAPNLLLAVVSAASALVMIASSSPSSQEILGVVTVAVLTLIVGFAEETMFRGILLRGALARYNVFLAMLISAVGFSLLHSVNVLGGEPAGSVVSQMGSTLLYGLFMAPLALLIGNLTPLVLLHFLWDFNVLAVGQVPSADASQGLLGITQVVSSPVQWVMTVVAWVVVFVLWRRGEFRNEKEWVFHQDRKRGEHEPYNHEPNEDEPGKRLR